MAEGKTTLQRVKDLEALTVRHGEILQGLSSDVEEITKVQRAQELKDVRDESFQTLVLSRLAKIEGIGDKALWVFFLALITAVAGFVIRGGLLL